MQPRRSLHTKRNGKTQPEEPRLVQLKLYLSKYNLWRSLTFDGLNNIFSTGSCKIGNNCTATVTTTTKSNGFVHVDVCYTHYGHKKELQHLRIPNWRRRDIAVKIRVGIHCDRILDDVRQSVAESLHRHHLLERKDITNIQKSYGLDKIRRHMNDQQSVLAWIEERKQDEETNPILFYTLQGKKSPDGYDLCDKDFFIVVQTPLQKHMLQQFGSNGVCCDSTHGTNAYDFSLTTLLVSDEFGKGFPVAWCLSNHEDFTTMLTFFYELKKNCGVIQSKFFMSDMAPQFYNAWVASMGEPRPKKLVCTWHVDKAWQAELKVKIGDTGLEAEIYKMLRMVLEQTNTRLFQDCVGALLAKLSSDLKMKEFHTYFVQDWLQNKEIWAYCYRISLGINTNMFTEAFHCVFKRLYLGGKVNKRVDSCLVNLLKFARDQCFGRVIQLTKGKANYRITQIEKRHQRGQNMPLTNVELSSDGSWKVTSLDEKKVYEVQHIHSQCPKNPSCRLTCKECQICIHQYVCNCPDSLILHTICKHIHLVERYRKSESDDPDELTMKIGYDNADSDDDSYNIEEINRLRSFAQSDNKVDLLSIRNRVTGKIFNLLHEASQSNDLMNLLQLEKQINSARSLFLSVEKDNTVPEVINMSDKARTTPANKNVEKQLRFFSTKKKRKNLKKIRFAKPTTDEKEQFLDDYREKSKF